jgi:hypothetical protein
MGVRGYGSGNSGGVGEKIERSARVGLGKHMETYHETIAAVK